MKTTKQIFYEYLNSEITDLVAKLKPEIKKKAVFMGNENADRKAGASCNPMTNPPTIVFHLNALEETWRPYLKKALKQLMSHELIHAIQGRITTENLTTKEKEAYTKQSKIDFFKK